MKVNILTEGFEGTGVGHLTRCQAIGDAFLERNIEYTIIANTDGDKFRYVNQGYSIQLDWLRDINALTTELNGSDIIIIDSYKADITFYNLATKLARVPVFFDDTQRITYPRGVIINGQNGAEKWEYSQSEYEHLLGINYLPLRKEFWDCTKQKRQVLHNVLLTIGVNSISGLFKGIINVLAMQFPNFHFNILTDSEDFAAYCKVGFTNTSIYQSLSAKQIVTLMRDCDLAVSAGGQTLNELIRLSVPTVAINIANNQLRNIKNYASLGLVKYAGSSDDPNIFSNICEKFNELISNINVDSISYTEKQNLIDGQGSRRIVHKLIEYSEGFK